MNERGNPSLVIVLGSHRSGTSVTTKMLEALGCNLGDALLPGDASSNPLGHFEHLEVNSYNENLLQKSGTTWFDPKPIDKIIKIPGQRDLVASEIRDLISKLVFSDGINAIKEPRIPLLLDLWGPELSRADIDLKVIIAMRHPNEVIASLVRRDSLNPILGMHIWAQSTINSIRFAREFDNCFVFYKSLLENPLGEMKRIRDHFGLGIIQNINEFLNVNLKQGFRHHNYADDDRAALGVASEIYDYIRLLDCANLNDFPDDLLDNWQCRLDQTVDQIDAKYLHSFSYSVRDSVISERDSVISERDLAISERDLAISERDLAISERDLAISERDLAISERDLAISERDLAISERELVLKSRTWRYTNWYRKFKSIFPKLRTFIFRNQSCG